MKQCRLCMETKDISLFDRNSHSKDGFDSRCKTCKRQRGRELYHSRTKDSFVVPDAKTCTRCGETKPIEAFTIAKNNRTGRSSHCKSCHSDYHNRQRLSGALAGGRAGWNRIKHSAANRGFDFDISRQDFEAWWNTEPHKCHYCSIDVDGFLAVRDAILAGTLKELGRFRQVFANPQHAKIVELSVERVDPDRGYALTNIVKACWVCNFIKGSILREEHMLLIGPQIRTEIEAIIAKHKYNTTRKHKHGGKAF